MRSLDSSGSKSGAMERSCESCTNRQVFVEGGVLLIRWTSTIFTRRIIFLGVT